jgi:ATP-dependent exoDNAse (exonuclease V) alpha subunit
LCSHCHIFVCVKETQTSVALFRPFGGNEPSEIGPHVYKLEFGGKVVGSRKQVPFQLGWALTIHKAIGLEVREVIVDLKHCWGPGQLYTAISRVRARSGLKVLSLPTRVHVETQMVHNFPKKFYKDLDNDNNSD